MFDPVFSSSTNKRIAVLAVLATIVVLLTLLSGSDERFSHLDVMRAGASMPNPDPLIAFGARQSQKSASLTAVPCARKALVFHAHNAQYLCGALVAAQSARIATPNVQFDVLIMLSKGWQVPASLLSRARDSEIKLRSVEPFANTISVNLRYRNSLDKLHAFNLTEYCRIVFFDSDTLVVRSIRPLFDDVPVPGAVADPVCSVFGRKSCLSSALLVLEPSVDRANAIAEALQSPTLKGQHLHDMNVLNFVLEDGWEELPRTYLMINWLWRQQGLKRLDRQSMLTREVRAIHFSSPKPWAKGWFDRWHVEVGERPFYRLWDSIASRICAT